MKLGLFFTLDMSLEQWDRLGLLGREKLVYEKLLESKSVETVYWFTYGANDKAYEKQLPPGLIVVPMPRLFSCRPGRLLYSLLAPYLLGTYLRDCDVIKTNQMRGSWTAVLAAWLYRKPLIVRTGFTWSLFAKRRGKIWSLDSLSGFVEGLAYRAADVAVVASRGDAAYVKEQYRLTSDKLNVIGNYIDVSDFRPMPDIPRFEDRMVFVGRLDPQKNLDALVRALAGLSWTLDIYTRDQAGRAELQALADSVGSRISFQDAVPNQQLAAVLNRYPLFVLPSLYEGMPKALLEAMACGLVVLGTDVPGTNEVIQHGENGHLVKNTDPESLRAGITALIGERRARVDLGRAAAAFIRENFSLESTVEKEIQLLKSLS